MKIRNAQIGDHVGIGTVHVNSWKETYVGLIPQDYLDGLKPETRISFWEEALKRSETRENLWVAENEDGEIIGFCCGGNPRKKDLGFDSELYAIYLYKKYQGKKIGKQLFQALVQKLLSQGKTSMYLWVVKNSKTCKVYESLGGVLNPQVQIDEIGGESIEELLYSFDLKSIST